MTEQGTEFVSVSELSPSVEVADVVPAEPEFQVAEAAVVTPEVALLIPAL